MRRIVGAVVIACTLALQAASAQPAARTAPPVYASVMVAKATETVIPTSAVGYGTIGSDPNAVLSVNAPFAARVEQVFARAGETVPKRAKLVVLEKTASQAAAYAQAQTAVTYAQGELKREQTLLGQHLATHAQVAQAQSALTDAEARLHALQSVGAGQARTVLTAPAAGIVSTETADVGQELAQGAPILMLSPSSARIVRLGVEPEQADKVQPGMAVALHNVLAPGQRMTGTAMSVSAVLDPSTRLRDVLVKIAPSPIATDPPPADGTFVEGVITLGQTKVIAVPRTAILMDEKGTYLFVVAGGLAQRVNVQTGSEANGLVSVTGAVKPGAEVVVQGNYELTQGMHVRVVSQ